MCGDSKQKDLLLVSQAQVGPQAAAINVCGRDGHGSSAITTADVATEAALETPSKFQA
jgi:hypothetical protein